MKRVFIHLLFVLILFSYAYPQENHQRILRAAEQREYQIALSELETLKNLDKKSFEINNYDYLLARMAEKTGDFAKAMANYQSVVSRNSVLKEYALWHLSQLARSSGNLLLERTYLQEIQTFSPESLLAEAVRTRLSRSYFESKNYNTAINLILNGEKSNAAAATTDSKSKIQNPKARENLVFLAQSYLQSGKTAEARDIFLQLINDLPNPAQPDDFALAGAQGLDLLDVGADKFGKEVPKLGDYEHVRRAQIYGFNRNFADSRLHYRAIVENHPLSGNVPDAIYQVGRTYAQTGEFSEAIIWFERVQEQFPDHPVSKDALSQTASAYARVGKEKEAVTRYEKFIEKYADAENLDRAYLNIIDVSRDAGEATEALKWTEKTQEVFRGKLPEALALFAQARIRITQNQWQNAIADLDKLITLPDLGGMRVPGGTNKAEITFMKAHALENLQRYAEAVEIYLSIPDGRSEYYGFRATERLKLLTNNETAKPFITQKIGEFSKNLENANADVQRKSAQAILRLNDAPEIRAKMLEIVKKSYSALPEYQKIPNFKLLDFGRKELLKEKRETSDNRHKTISDELLFLGLYDEATPELEQSFSKDQRPKTKDQNSKSDLDYTLAVFYKRGEMAHRAVGFIEPLWKNVPADYQIELMPREQAELLYPAPYADALIRYAPERNVDPRYVLSIMRQESRYRADVKSYAAARGLMQFISTTAQRIARELNRENFKQDELYHPPTAILFGSQYLANLYKMFPVQHQAVAASYNGGEDNVRRWMNRSKSDLPDRYVPELVFSQSKDYAYKVSANFRIYQMIYDENLKSK